MIHLLIYFLSPPLICYYHDLEVAMRSMVTNASGLESHLLVLISHIF